MIKIYGTLPSRLFRCLWMLEELDLQYEWVRVPFDQLREPQYLDLNPNGKMPVLRDGDLVLWESMAINLYLADKYDRGLWPKRIEERARAIQWTLWGVCETERHVFTALNNRVFLPQAKRDEAAALAAVRELSRPLAVLDRVLGTEAFVVAGVFSAADLNLASVLSSLILARAELDPFPNVNRWLGDCLRRDYPAQFFERYL